MKKAAFATIVLVLIIAGVAPMMATRSPKGDITRNLDIFNAINRELQTTYVDTIDAEKILNIAIASMLNSLDPYTEYISEEKQEEFETISTGEYAGIGSTIITREHNNVYISEPREGSPAHQAGLLPGDLIISIDGDTVLGLGNAEVSKRLKGQPGTTITVRVKRPYVQDSILDFDITRATIKVGTLPYYGVVRDKIGYIGLTTFNEKSPQVVKDALIELKKNPNVEAIVLDLRDNGGGLLESAVQIAGLFVPKGTEILRYRGRDITNEKIFKTTQNPVDTEIPLFILVDGGTASSSEIVAGSMQDLDRAVIVGNRSFGKGLVQSTRPLPYNGLLKVTTAKYYIPSGRLIQALDYSNRNPDGTPGHTPDSLANVFYTKAGREVRDGGGILPEVIVEYPKYNMLTYTVVNDLWSFDFANKFYSTHPTIAPNDEFVVTDTIFEEFKAFINPDKFKYDVLTDASLKHLRETAEMEGYLNDSVKAQIDILENLMKHDLYRDLDINRDQIDQILGGEIASRYYFDAGRAAQQLRTDPAIDSVEKILNTPGKYKELLSAPKQSKDKKSKDKKK